jgi:hypothetical protein
LSSILPDARADEKLVPAIEVHTVAIDSSPNDLIKRLEEKMAIGFSFSVIVFKVLGLALLT